MPGSQAATIASASIQDRLENQRPAGDEHHDHRNAGRFHVLERRDVLGRQRQLGRVAVAFGVGRLADHHDADVGTLRAAAVFGNR